MTYPRLTGDDDYSDFPADFLWGAATAAHQVEGGTHNQWTVWELENARSLAAKAEAELSWLPAWEHIGAEAMSPDNYLSGDATKHYYRYDDDFDILANQLHMNAFRFSIEWSRLEPVEGQWNEVAMQHYRDYVDALQRRGVTPMMTLMHWTLPTWFTDKGAFEKTRNIRYFVRFAERVIREMEGRVQLICTLNEPEVYMAESYLDGTWPPSKRNRLTAARVYLNLARAHNELGRVLPAVDPEVRLGLSKNCAHNFPSDLRWQSRLTARLVTYLSDYFFLDRVKGNLHWLGLNHYFTNGYGRFMLTPVAGPDLSDMGWEMHPGNIQFVLQRLHARYGLPIIITENGVADATDTYRRWWIEETIEGMRRAIKNGVDLQGYLHWSLLDNFEWAHGKWPRFGLVAIDYTTFARTLRPSAVWYGKLIRQIRKRG